MRRTLLGMALALAGCGAAAEPGEDALREALARRGGNAALTGRLSKLDCKQAEGGRYVCDYELPDCPPYKPQCGHSRVHSGRFAEIAGGWQYLGPVSIDPAVAVRDEPVGN